ncbi:hypothetical protein COO16_03875 [Bacillus pseudomycoides]|uniref:hypothetical protein n=1 Tax=Bacillus pseudomycoides TaxID=64104 RepID=UPI000BECCEC9|nr:hypothetical protein [Bacillus pseudomycoides]PDY14109.1 hypothetical protein COO16_03875 [Bacillus pseudomycoides]
MKRIQKFSLLFVMFSLFVVLTACGSKSVELNGKWNLSGSKHIPFNHVEDIEFKNGKILTSSDSFPYTNYEFNNKEDKNGNMEISLKSDHEATKKYYLKRVDGSKNELYITNAEFQDEYKDMVLTRK